MNFYRPLQSRVETVLASTPSWLKTLVKYVASGGTAAVVQIGLLFVFTHFFGIWYVLSSFFAFIFAFIVSFTLQKFWTFKDKGLSRVHSQGFLYFAVQVINLALNTTLLYILVEYLSLHYLLAQIIVGIVVAVWSFFIYQFIIFRPSSSAN